MWTKGGVIINRVVVFLFLIPFFKPRSLQYILPSLDSLYDYLRMIDVVLITMLYVKKVLLKRNAETFLYLLFGCETVFVISTVIHEQNIKGAILDAILAITFCMFIEMETKENYVNFITALYVLLYTLVSINFVVLICYPSGVAMTEYYSYSMNFWGIDNYMVNLLIFAVAVGLLYQNIKNAIGKWTVPVLILMCATTTIILWSATGVVGFFLYILFMIFICNKSWQKYCSPYFVYLVIWVISGLLVFIRIQTFFSSFIEKVLKKKVNLSGRTEMWDQAIQLIKNNLFLGYGRSRNQGYIIWHHKLYYTHNGILEILIQGGICALLFAGALYIVSAKCLSQYRAEKETGILLGAIASLMVTLWTEAYIHQIELYGLLMFSCLIPYIQMQQIDGRKRHHKIIIPKIVIKRGNRK